MRAISVLACLGVILMGLGAPVSAERSGHDAVNFVRALDRIREGPGQTYDADLVRGTHGTGPAQVDVTPFAGEVGDPAQAGQDFPTITRTVHFPDPIASGTAEIPITDDAIQEGPETITLRLESPTNGMVRAFPNELTLTILDNDGLARLSFELAEYEVFENKDHVRAYVVRSGPISGAASVQYETSGGSATEGQDYEGQSGTLNFSAGDDFEWIDVPLVDNGTAEPDETFTLTLSSPAGSALIEPSSATITIQDEESGTADFTPPYTAFHQPLHHKKYRPKEIRSLIAFMQDNNGGTGMKRVDLALRMNRDDGSCRWWNGTRFRKGPCRDPSTTGNKRWADVGRGTETKVAYFTDTAIFTLGKALKGSGPRSDIRNYTAYCRGRDVAGNLQDNFDKGQNRNTFDVRGGG